LRPVGDVDALAEAVRKLLDNDELRIQLGEAGRDAVQQFTWEKNVRQFEHILKGEE